MFHMVSSRVDHQTAETSAKVWSQVSRGTDPTAAETLRQVGTVLDKIFKDPSPGRRNIHNHRREIAPPSKNAAYRSDMLISMVSSRADDTFMPIWVTCAESPLAVIDTVLSIYARRGRLPEPGEIVFCFPDSELDEIKLVFHRFLRAQSNGRGDYIFCVANVHALSYTAQMTLVKELRQLFDSEGLNEASILCFISGKPRQAILSSLSRHAVDLPPLEDKELKKACKDAFQVWCGRTETVQSAINGGGKTQRILCEVARAQRENDGLGFPLYQRVPIRESTTCAALVQTLNQLQNPNPQPRNAIHLDIAHIIPASTNTILFQLLLIGVVADRKNYCVYFRRKHDMYYIEIPNSASDRTRNLLRVCSLFPGHMELVTPENTQLVKPFLRIDRSMGDDMIWPEFTRINVPQYEELSTCCHMLRAYRDGKFDYGTDSFVPEFSPLLDEPVTGEDCFHLICEMCSYDSPVRGPGKNGPPSFLLFASFASFMSSLFKYLIPEHMGGAGHFIFNDSTVEIYPQLKSFKKTFCKLLIEVSKDFSLRSVPRNRQFGAAHKLARDSSGGGPPRRISVRRAGSAEVTRLRRHTAGPPPPAPPMLVREHSLEALDRFCGMRTWEDTEHPVVLFYVNHVGACQGIDIMALNKNYTSRFISGDLQRTLTDISNKELDFNKDWSKMKSEKGIEVLRKVEGGNYSLDIDVDGAPPMEPSYVLTIDNLLKMLSILLRMKYNLPVVIMGETGCGKSSLIRQLCAIIKMPLFVLNIHGGMSDHDVIVWLKNKIEVAKQRRRQIVCFLDEVNTCNSMGLFKEIICDRSLNGVQLPADLLVISACNPYRMRASNSETNQHLNAGLVYDAHQTAVGALLVMAERRVQCAYGMYIYFSCLVFFY